MNYEQKYKEALERARKIENREPIDVPDGTSIPVAIFPELKESEDERIRKAIHIYLDWLDGRKEHAPKGAYSIRDMIAWLEKQGKQKPSWSEEDELMLKDAIEFIETGWSDKGKSHLVYWLKSLKQRIGE